MAWINGQWGNESGLTPDQNYAAKMAGPAGAADAIKNAAPNAAAAAAKKAADNAAKGLDADGMPIRPTWQSLVDPATGVLKDQYNVKSGTVLPGMEDQLKGINLNTAPLSDLENYAKIKGPTQQAQYLLDNQKLSKQQQLDSLMNTGANAGQSAWSQLAMKGGASSGARERIATAAGTNLNSGRQNLEMTNNQANLGILSGDEANKLGVMQALPGQEIASLQPALTKAQMYGQAQTTDVQNSLAANEYNASNAINERNAKGAFDLGNYSEAMKAWAGNKQADATAASGGGLSYICTAVHKVSPLSKDELKTLDEVRLFSVEYCPSEAQFYFKYCEELIPRLESMNVSMREFKPFVKLVVKYANEFGMEYALDFYSDYVQEMLKLYTPDLANIFETQYKQKPKVASALVGIPTPHQANQLDG